MAVLEIYNDIVPQDEKTILKSWTGVDGICFADIKEFINSIDENDDNIDIHIHCRGGSCMEGWAIYDALRTSGKKITATIDGECSSMASVILLAAPKESRSAQKNATLLIHNPFISFYDLWGDKVTADDMDKLRAKLEAQANELRLEQNKIVNLYVERTGSDAETLQSIMNTDTSMNMKKARELGFINNILEPNTDRSKRQKNMKKVAVDESLFKCMLNKLGIKKVEDLNVVNMTVSAVDGQELTIDREEGDPQVGDTASPDGEFVMEDGSTVTVSGGVITNIAKCDPNKDPEKDPDEEEDKDGKNIVEDEENGVASADLETLNKTIAEMSKSIEGLKKANATLSKEVTALNADAISQDERNLLETVNKHGGAEWLERVSKLSSSFRPDGKDFNGKLQAVQEQSVGRDFLADWRSKHKRI
ncbi:MAG: Clp protease ClpP [Muribaculaceae bacterium]